MRWRPRFAHLLALCGAAALSAPARAQVEGRAPQLSIVVDTAKRTLEPGQAATFPVVIRDLAAREHDVTLTTAVPTGWRVLSVPSRVHVPANGRAIELVQIVPAADAPAGDYAILHSLRAAGLDSDLVVSAAVSVRPRRLLTVTLLDAPYFAASDATSHATFVVSNRGNVATRVQLRVHAEREMSVHWDPVGELKPGESKTVVVSFDAGSLNGEQEARRHISVVAEAEGGLASDDAVSPAAVAGVRVIERTSDAASPWYSLPMFLRLSRTQSTKYQSFDAGSSLNFEMSGGGPAFDGSTTSLDFVARSRQPDEVLTGQRDEYRIGISGSHFGVRLGDQLFRLTPLTDGGSFASGISTWVTRDAFTIGGLANRDRWLHDGSGEQASFVGFDPSKRFHFSANLLHNDEFGATDGSMYARAMLTSRSLIEVERGRGLFGAGSGSSATLARAAGDQGWIAFELRDAFTDTAYHAVTGGVGSQLASLTVRPSGWFHLTADAEQVTSPEDYNSLLNRILDGRRETTRRADLAFDLAGLLAGGLRRISAPVSIDSTLARPNETQASSWMRISRGFGRLSLTASTERGRVVIPDSAHRPFSVDRLQAGIRLFSVGTVGGYVERSTGQSLFSTTGQTIYSAGASASLQLRALSLVASADGAPSTGLYALPDSATMLPGAIASLDGTASLALGGGRAISLRIRSISAGRGKPVATSVRIAYELPLHLPVGRSRSQGRVVGRVFDDQSNAGVANALVRIGDRMALTDERGYVAVGGLSPARYPVAVDLGTNQTGSNGLADDGIEVAPTPGRTTTLNLRVTRLGRLTGHLNLFERVASNLAADSARYRKSGGLGGIVVRFVRGSEERRALTSPDGSFELRDARPGLWQVILPSSDLPAQTYVEGDSVRTIDLGLGETKDLEIRVLPRQRRILPLDAPPSGSAPAPVPPRASSELALATPLISRLSVPAERIVGQATAAEPLHPIGDRQDDAPGSRRNDSRGASNIKAVTQRQTGSCGSAQAGHQLDGRRQQPLKAGTHRTRRGGKPQRKCEAHGKIVVKTRGDLRSNLVCRDAPRAAAHGNARGSLRGNRITHH